MSENRRGIFFYLHCRRLWSHEVITQRVSPVIFNIMGPTYWCHDLDLSASRDVSCHVTFWFPRCHFL